MSPLINKGDVARNSALQSRSRRQEGKQPGFLPGGDADFSTKIRVGEMQKTSFWTKTIGDHI